MDFAKIRPRGGTKAQWGKANPVLAKREIGVQWETTIGVGEVVIKIGDGVTDWINLPEAVKSDITKKIIAALAVVPDDDPDLADGDSLDTLFGKIAKKFKYLKDNKLDKSARYDGTDSTSTELVPTANALRGVNAKADKNASDITTLNNNLSNPDRINLNVLIEKTSLNSPERTGVYYVTGNNIGALPSGFSNYGILLCMRSPYSLHPTNSNCVYVQEYTDVYGKHASRSFNNGAWTNWVTTATKDDLDKRFSSSDSGTTYNSVSDFPKTGSGFGVNTINLTIYTGFVIPAFSRICYMNYGKSTDGALIAIAPSGEIYSAFRNMGVWQNGKVR